MNRSRSGDDRPDDRLLAEAYAALDRTIPDGYFDDFSSRVLARLDELQESSMEGRSDLARGSGVTRPEDAPAGNAAAAAQPKREEHSGLHEIKALASTTRRRLSQRISSQQEAEESLLVASSGSFKSVALPDPSAERPLSVAPLVVPEATPAPELTQKEKKERREAPAAVEKAAAKAAAAVEPAPFRVPPKPSSAPWWVLGGVATLAAAAAVVVFVFGVGRGGGEESEAGSTLALAEQPEVAPGAPGDSPAVGGAAAAPSASVPAVTSLESAAEAEPTAPEPDQAEGRAERDEERESSRSARRGARAEASDGNKDAKKDANKAAAEPSAAKDEGKPAKPPPATSGEGEDLEDVLDQVTGGIDAPKEIEDEPKKPAKKELNRRDVATAMAGVRDEALKCYSVENYQGTVTAKFTVEPSGAISSVTTDKKGPTGDCVARAVKKAKFPAFDGAPTSFTYPFLLAE